MTSWARNEFQNPANSTACFLEPACRSLEHGRLVQEQLTLLSHRHFNTFVLTFDPCLLFNQNSMNFTQSRAYR